MDGICRSRELDRGIGRRCMDYFVLGCYYCRGCMGAACLLFALLSEKSGGTLKITFTAINHLLLGFYRGKLQVLLFIRYLRRLFYNRYERINIY